MKISGRVWIFAFKIGRTQGTNKKMRPETEHNMNYVPKSENEVGHLKLFSLNGKKVVHISYE